MKLPSSISESERKVLVLLWEKSPQAAYDLAQRLKESDNWHRNTVNTILSRLVKKGFLKTEKYKTLYHFTPLISQKEFIQSQSQSFLERVFDGAVEPLLLHFAEQGQLSDQQLQELRKILNQEKES